jgi:DNA-binding PadR family transcriptional regulator
MSLEHVLLGMLRDPASGYDLRKEFERGPRHFWSANLSQIYPALQAMEKQGWLASRSEPSARGPARRVYRRTRAGTLALHRWLRGAPVLGTERLAYIGQLIFQGELREPARTLRFLKALRARFASFLKGLETGERALRRAHRRPPARWEDDDFHELLCLRLGVQTYRARVAACNECMRLIKARMRRKERVHVRRR